MGMAPSVVEQMAATDFDLLARYWAHEPWGPWRDNMHAAIIAREIRRPHLKDPRKPTPLSEFILRDPDEIEQEKAERQTDRVKGLFTFFRTVAKRKKKPADDKPRAKRRQVQQ